MNFDRLYMICHNEVIFGSCLSGVLSISCTWISMSLKLRKFQLYHGIYILNSFSFFFAFRNPQNPIICPFNGVTFILEVVFVFYELFCVFFFFFFVIHLGYFKTPFPGWDILYAVWSILFLRLPVAFLFDLVLHF